MIGPLVVAPGVRSAAAPRLALVSRRGAALTCPTLPPLPFPLSRRSRSPPLLFPLLFFLPFSVPPSSFSLSYASRPALVFPSISLPRPNTQPSALIRLLTSV